MFMNLEILFQDEDLLVVNKQAGVSVEGDEDCLERQLQKVFDARLRALHRLDKGTSGVLAFSLRRKHHAQFVKLWEERRIRKIYWALVEGCWENPPRELAGEDSEGRPMKSYLKVLQVFGDRSLVELELRSGRRHQARIQCSRAGFPVVGDTRYGAKADPVFGDAFALHARSLSFQHPLSGEKLSLVAPLPEVWKI